MKKITFILVVAISLICLFVVNAYALDMNLINSIRENEMESFAENLYTNSFSNSTNSNSPGIEIDLTQNSSNNANTNTNTTGSTGTTNNNTTSTTVATGDFSPMACGAAAILAGVALVVFARKREA